MSSVFSTAISGMQTAITRLSSAATNIANISSAKQSASTEQEKTTSFEPKDIISLTNTNESGLVAEITDSILAEIAYKANIKTIQIEKENKENLIDTLA